MHWDGRGVFISHIDVGDQPCNTGVGKDVATPLPMFN